MALGLAARQGWWRSCLTGAIFPSAAGSALSGRLAGLGSVRCGARGSHAPGAEGGQWGQGRTAELGACVALSLPGPRRPGHRLEGEGAAAPASCSLPLAFVEGWAARPGWQRAGSGRAPSLSPHPLGQHWSEGFPSPLLLPETGRLCLPCPGRGQGIEAFPSSLSINFERRVKPGYKIA